MTFSTRFAPAALIGVAAALMSLHGAVFAQTAGAPVAKPAAKPVAKPAAKPTEAGSKAATQPAKKPLSQSRKEIKSEAKGLALATDVTETISDNQLLISNRVLTGSAQCEFNQTVDVQPIRDQPGHFKVAFNKASWTMTPQETTTGAVRLEDKRNGIVWLQIPTKSMMMNQKIGQRMVDSCMHAEQTAAVNAVAGAAR